MQILAALVLLLQDPTAEKLAGCVKLYEDFTGREAKSLDELGEFHVGPIPAGYRIEKRRVGTVPLAPPSRTPIVPPNEKLRKLFDTRVRVELVRLEARAFLARTGKLPTKREDLGTVPKDIDVRFNAACVIVRAEGEIAPTDEERAALDKASRVESSEDDRRSIEAALDRMSDDDLETREEAERELVALGAFARTQLEARLKAAKDADVRRWLSGLASRLPPWRPSWNAYAGAICAYVQSGPGARRLDECSNNLKQLLTMQHNYRAQFGGRAKLMPSETGGDFWLKLMQTMPPLIDSSLEDIYWCPAAEKPPGSGKTSYAGPSQDVNTFADEDPVGVCDDEGHGGLAIVLTKSGHLQVVTRDDAIFKKAQEKTKK